MRNTYLNAQFRRIAARHGSKRAHIAVIHTILTTIWNLLARQTPYQDLGPTYYLDREDPDRQRRRAVAQLERLGFAVTIEPTTA